MFRWVKGVFGVCLCACVRVRVRTCVVNQSNHPLFERRCERDDDMTRSKKNRPRETNYTNTIAIKEKEFADREKTRL